MALSATSRMVSSGCGQLEQVELRRADVPAHRIGEVDQVLVAGQHQVVGGRRAEVDRADILDVDLLHPVDRRRQRKADARAERAAVAAKVGDHAALPRRDRVHRREDQPHGDEAERRPT